MNRKISNGSEEEQGVCNGGGSSNKSEKKYSQKQLGYKLILKKAEAPRKQIYHLVNDYIFFDPTPVV